MSHINKFTKIKNCKFTFCLANTLILLGASVNAQVTWDQAAEQQSESKETQEQILNASDNFPVLPKIITWELVPITNYPRNEKPKALIWKPVQATKSVKDDSNSSNTIVWKVAPKSETPLIPELDNMPGKARNAYSMGQQETHQSEKFEKEGDIAAQPQIDPPAPLQALNRSVAFGDGLMGPDIGWYVPNGFRWSQRWFADATIQGQSRRRNNQEFSSWNNGDAVATIHANLLQTTNWSVGINTSFRSVYQGSNAAGGSTPVGEGISSGFRIAKALNGTSGLAFGGEQILQWDSKTDTGRNFYVMASKGWWIGNKGQNFPLIIANGGLGTGRFANQDIQSWENPLRFACIENAYYRTDSFSVDNDLCWSPIGSVSIVVDELWGMFLEYRSGTAQLAASANLSGELPFRITWGVNFAKKNKIQTIDELTWVFRASVGF